jgi:F-type H+-transporting ATPase subunit alpha
MIIFAATNGILDDVPTEELKRFESEFIAFMDSDYPDVVRELATDLKIGDKVKEELTKAANKFKARFMEGVKTTE